MLITKDDLYKLNNSPKSMEKLINKILTSDKKNLIISLFELVNSSDFYEYLITKNYIVYFSKEETNHLLDNKGFIYYIFKTNFNYFNSMKNDNITKELCEFIENHYYDFLNNNFDFYKYPKLINSNIFNLLLDNISNKEDYYKLLNSVSDSNKIKIILESVIKNDIKLDPGLLNKNLLNNPDIGKYLVYNIDIKYIDLLKGEAYKNVYTNILEDIKYRNIDFTSFTKENFPLGLRTKAVLESLVYNPKNYFLLSLFNDNFFDDKIDYIIYTNSDIETKKLIVQKHFNDTDFFTLYLGSMNVDDSHLLAIFDIENMGEEIIDLMIQIYNSDNKIIRNYFLKMDNNNFKYIDKIYKALLLKEQNSAILESIIDKFDANKMSYETLNILYLKIKNNQISFSKLNNSFLCSNVLFNIMLENKESIYIKSFKSKALDLKEEYPNEDNLIDSIIDIDYPEYNLYLYTYLNKFNKEQLVNKKFDKHVLHELTDKFDKKTSELIIHLSKVNNRNPLSIKYLNSDITEYAYLHFGDILNIKTRDYLNSLSLAQLSYINPFHIRTIYNMLDNFIYEDENKLILAINMYMVLGFNRTISLLNPDAKKNYGPLTEKKLIKMFINFNVANVSFIQDGYGFCPLINEELINLAFGKNFKTPNTPIKGYLNGINNNSDVMEDKALIKYYKNVNNFFNNNFAFIFNNWNLVKEEFYRKQNISNLKLKLNVSTANEIADYILKVRSLVLSPRDKLLTDSDVFKYAGNDNKYVYGNYNDVPKRIVDISRCMDNNNKKMFPNINFEEGSYTLKTFNPQDRGILSIGYKTDCCFRALGDADNRGRDNSFLKYCAVTEYGGGIVITNRATGNIIFSPVLVNGNTLMLHSIESVDLESKESEEVFNILKEYGQRVINSSDNNNPIDFVLMTNASFFNTNVISEQVNINKKFFMYDADFEYFDAYNNLDRDQFIVAKKDNLTQNDINYYAFMHEYEYPDYKSETIHVSIDEVSLKLINSMEYCQEKICKLSDKRFHLDKDSESAYKILLEINNLKKDYLKIYSSLLKYKPNSDVYNEYKNGLKLVNEINSIGKVEIDSFKSKLKKMNQLYYNTDWYILINDNNVVFNYTDKGKEDCLNLLNDLSLAKENDNENVGRSRRV